MNKPKEQPAWKKTDDAAYVAKVGNIVLIAMPIDTITRKFKTRPARGTKWRA